MWLWCDYDVDGMCVSCDYDVYMFLCDVYGVFAYDVESYSRLAITLRHVPYISHVSLISLVYMDMTRGYRRLYGRFVTSHPAEHQTNSGAVMD